ncbi:MAG TPA: site-specific integrase, partial [Solirubrobacteraceae bacterium]|nr:site-specific integrase [Solirubrobacteraceae bacterium]
MGWSAALALLDAELARRGAAARSRRAYASDLRQLASWATRHGAEPATTDVRLLRRYAAERSAAGA